MRLLLAFLVLAAAAVSVALLARINAGYALFVAPPYRIELSLNTFFALALLAFVVLTDEDDCSRSDNNFTIQNDTCATMQGTNPVAHYKTVLDGVAQGEGRWAAAVIAGQTQCKSSFGDAIEAKRLKEFTSLPGVKSTFSSICDGDLSVALDKALDLFDGACKTLPPATVK